ncbi:MAG: hypothetical protein ABIQ64_04610 [Candidatus Saccharimonadales bacterium]
MPFTGTGTGIQNANDIFFSALAANNVLRYNNATAKWNNGPLVVANSEIADNTITEAKLSVANTPSLNQLMSWDGSSLSWVTATKSTVGLANVDNTSDVNKPVSTATQTALSGKADDSAVVHDTGAETIAGIKTFSSSPVVPTPTLGTQATNKTYVDGLITTTPDATVSSKGIVQLAGDLGGTAALPTVPGLTGKASTATTITGANSVSGGGSLAANRTLSLVNDSVTPGNSKYYGTNGTGTKGFYDIPAGDPALGGDLSGTASAAQIVSGAVGPTELATSAVTTVKIIDGGVTEPKLAATNSPTTGQVLSWNGTGMSWAGALAFAFTKVSITANHTVASTFQYIFADATTTGITVTLPAPQSNAYVRVKRMSINANGVQVVAPAGSYLDDPSVGSDSLNNPFDSAEYWSDGSNWYR